MRMIRAGDEVTTFVDNFKYFLQLPHCFQSTARPITKPFIKTLQFKDLF